MIMVEKEKYFKILIVDDVPKNIQVAANILQKHGYRMAFAQSGETALSQTRNHRFDLILLDIMMPGMDGFEVCRQLRQNSVSKDVPVIFLTAKNDTDSIIRGFESGATDYVTKPFNGAELSARVRTHLELSHTRRKLEEANAAKNKFFSIIAHDLKNPFHSLIGVSRHLLSKYDQISEDRKRDYLQLIHNTSEHTYQLLENLLDWSRIQTERMEWNPMEIGIDAIAHEAIAVHEPLAKKKNILLDSTVRENVTAFADPNMIMTVMHNLVSNAIKFTNEGGSVNIKSTTIDNFESVSVCDTGIGMNDSLQKMLFRIDTHNTRPGTDNEHGTGLGLILCRDFVEKNGGQICVESLPNKGSTFVFTLPKFAAWKKKK